MTISDEARARIVEAMHEAYRTTRVSGISGQTTDAVWRNQYARSIAALDAALSAGLADAIREQALREAAEAVRLSLWKYERTDAYSHGWDIGAISQNKADRDAIEALIGKPAPKQGDE